MMDGSIKAEVRALALLGVLFLMTMTYATTYSCYQEAANESNQTGRDGSCGLTYTGIYLFDTSGDTVGDPVTYVNGLWSSSESLYGLNITSYYTTPNDGVEGIEGIELVYGLNYSGKGEVNESLAFDASCLPSATGVIYVGVKSVSDYLNLKCSFYCLDNPTLGHWTLIPMGEIDDCNASFIEEGLNWTMQVTTTVTSTSSAPSTTLCSACADNTPCGQINDEGFLCYCDGLCVLMSVPLNVTSCSISPAPANSSANLTANGTAIGDDALYSWTFQWMNNSVEVGTGGLISAQNLTNVTLICTLGYEKGNSTKNSSTLTIGDTTAPALNCSFPTSSGYTDTAYSLGECTCTDANSLATDSPKVDFLDPNGVRVGNLSLTGTPYSRSYTYSVVGSYSNFHYFCADGSGNLASNLTNSFAFAASTRPVVSGGGGGGSTTVVNNYGSASYSFTVLPSTVKPIDTIDFLPGSSTARGLQVTNKESFELDTYYTITGNASKYCTITQNITVPGGNARIASVSCTMGLEAHEGEVYAGNITVRACKPSTPTTQCDTRSAVLLLPLAKARQTALALSIPEEINGLSAWFSGLEIMENIESDPLPYAALAAGVLGVGFITIFLFDTKTRMIRRIIR
jgi:hypothetical protein